MYRKNVASQVVCFQGVDASTGGIKTGVSWTVRRCIDGTFAAGGGTVTEDGTTGWYKYAMSQADTNGNNVSFNFTGSGAVPQTVNLVTTAADPTSATNFGLTDVSAIKAKTDLIPASPAAVGSAMTLADGAITDAKITMPTEATGTPSTFLQLMMWLAGCFGWRKFVKDSNTGTLTQMMDDGTTTKTTSTYTSAGGIDTINKAS